MKLWVPILLVILAIWAIEARPAEEKKEVEGSKDKGVEESKKEKRDTTHPKGIEKDKGVEESKKEKRDTQHQKTLEGGKKEGK